MRGAVRQVEAEASQGSAARRPAAAAGCGDCGGGGSGGGGGGGCGGGVYVREWMRTRHAAIFRLSNDDMQVGGAGNLDPSRVPA